MLGNVILPSDHINLSDDMTGLQTNGCDYCLKRNCVSIFNFLSFFATYNTAIKNYNIKPDGIAVCYGCDLYSKEEERRSLSIHSWDLTKVTMVVENSIDNK